MLIQPFNVIDDELLVPLAEVYLHQALDGLVGETLLYQFGRVAADDGIGLGGADDDTSCCHYGASCEMDAGENEAAITYPHIVVYDNIPLRQCFFLMEVICFKRICRHITIVMLPAKEYNAPENLNRLIRKEQGAA